MQPTVLYVYDDSGNYSRLASMTYPDGRVLSYGYDQYGREVTVAAGSNPTQNILEQDTYLGLSTLVQRVFPQVQIMMTNPEKGTFIFSSLKNGKKMNVPFSGHANV